MSKVKVTGMVHCFLKVQSYHKNLVFYFSAIRRDIDLKCIQDTYIVVLNSMKNIDLHMSKVKVTGTVHCFLKVQSYHKNLVFYFSAIRRDIDLKCIQDTYIVVLNSMKNIDLHMSKVKVTGTVHCFLKVQSYHKNLVFYFSAIRRDIDLKCIQDTYIVVLNSMKNIDLHMSKVKVTGTVHCFLKVQSYHKNWAIENFNFFS